MFRISKNDRSEYKRLAKNTKSKIKRVNKNFGIDLIPDFPTPKLEDFTSRKEFNAWKAKQNSFTNRSNKTYQFKKNKYGVVSTVKEIDQIKADTKIAQKLAKQKINNAKDKPFISGGKVQGKIQDRLKQMSKEEIAGVSVPVNFDFEAMQTTKRLEDKKRYMHERTTDDFYKKKEEQMLKNFISMLERGFNSDADEVVEKLKKVSPDDFSELYVIIDEFDFNQYSSDNEGGLNEEGKLDVLNHYLDMFLNNEIDMSLKNFR